MEKAVVFGPMIIFGVFFGVMVVGFLAIVFKLISKAKNDSYRGKVIKKTFFTSENTEGDSTDFYTLELECEDGKNRKVPVGASEYKAAKEGDIYIKEKGKLRPHKIQ